VAEDMYEFITAFMSSHPQYAKLQFFVTGESYVRRLNITLGWIELF